MQHRLIDYYFPKSEIRTQKSVAIDAKPTEVYQSLLALDCTKVSQSSRFMRALSFLREFPHHLTRLPYRLYQWMRNQHSAAPEEISYQLKDLSNAGAWVKLAEEPDQEFVFGLIGKLWYKNYGALMINADEFIEFNEPGYAKTACSFTLIEQENGLTRLTYEIRTGTTDWRTRPLYYLYWLSIEIGVLYLMHCVLQAVKQQAEKTNLQHWGEGSSHLSGNTA